MVQLCVYAFFEIILRHLEHLKEVFNQNKPIILLTEIKYLQLCLLYVEGYCKFYNKLKFCTLLDFNSVPVVVLQKSYQLSVHCKKVVYCKHSNLFEFNELLRITGKNFRRIEERFGAGL